MKTVLAIVVGAAALVQGAHAQSDCNTNQVDDQLELASGRAFDDDGDGIVDECQRLLPRMKSLYVESAGCGWDTETPGFGPWDLFVARSSGVWINEDSIGRAEIGLRIGVNDFRTAHSAPYCGANRLTIFLEAGTFPPSQLRIDAGQSPQTTTIGYWRVKLSNYAWLTAEGNEWSPHSHQPDQYPDINGSFRVEVEIDPAFDCNANGIVDAAEIQQSASLDCNNNGRIDACETGYADCNTNSIPDSCDIASGTAADADGNGVPDTCQPDCNLNDLPDAFEIASGLVSDLNADGTPDDCQGARMVRLRSPNLGAPSGDAARVWNVAELLPSETAVTIAVDLRGDLNGQTEWADIVLNNDLPRRFFAAGGNDCPAVPDRAVITLTREEYNDLIGADGLLSVRVVCPPAVDETECKGDGLTEVMLSYVGITPAGDCNGNSRLDVAETHDGTTPDCNANKRPDSCDIASGTSSDCNANGIPDSCELASTPAIDCNANGIIDSCDLATGGATVDCDLNGRIDSCQVTETPGTDCNGNLRPDACDVASGTSADRDGNLQPDECQTVAVPGDYASIQQAIDTAPASVMRIIAVAPGTYAGPIAFNGKPVVVRGTAGAASTVISGSSGQQLSVVRFTGGEPAIAALERVTVRGGASGSPIPTNQTVLVGGGLFGLDSAASVRDCVFENNAAGFGGGAYFLRCSGGVSNCVFRNNSASSDGGGLQSNQGTQRLTDVTVQGNSANSRGGGLHLVQGQPALTRVQVLGNQCSNVMGGLSWFSPGDPSARLELTNCTVTGNAASLSFGGVGITETVPPPTAPTVAMLGTTVCGNAPRPNMGGRYQDLGGNTVCDCPADLTTDGQVNGADLGVLLSAWGPCTGACAADLNADGVVNGADLGALLSAWGQCG